MKIVKKKVKEWSTWSSNGSAELKNLPNGYILCHILIDEYYREAYHYASINGDKVDITIFNNNYNESDEIDYRTPGNYIKIDLDKHNLLHYKTRGFSICFAGMLPIEDVLKGEYTAKNLKKMVKTINIIEVIKNCPNFTYKTNDGGLEVSPAAGKVKLEIGIEKMGQFYDILFKKIESTSELGPEIARVIKSYLKNYLVNKGLVPEVVWPGFSEI